MPILPAFLLSRRSQAPRDAEVEPVDVVVIAASLDTAGGLAVPWARVVGIAVEEGATAPVVSACPTVSGVSGLLGAVVDGALVLIDGDRGAVLVDPSPEMVAAFQAERERLTPRRRIYLDYAHEPARTVDGAEVRVFASLHNAADAREAIAGGADGLYLPTDRDVLRPEESDDEQLDALLELADIAGGKPIIISGDVERVSVAALMRAALRADVTLAVPAALGAPGLVAINAHIDQTTAALLEQDLDFAAIQVALTLSTGDEPGDLLGSGAARLVAECDRDEGAGYPDWIAAVVRISRPALVPVLASAARADWEACIKVGAAGLIVGPGEVADAKAAIRGLYAQR